MGMEFESKDVHEFGILSVHSLVTELNTIGYKACSTLSDRFNSSLVLFRKTSQHSLSVFICHFPSPTPPIFISILKCKSFGEKKNAFAVYSSAFTLFLTDSLQIRSVNLCLLHVISTV